MASDAVKASLREWISDSGVDSEHVDVVGPAKRFYIHVRGGPAAAPRAVALSRALRRPGGQWRSFSATTPSGQQCPLYVGADKAPKQVRREMHTKRALALLTEMYPQAAWSANRSHGLISRNSVPVVELVPQGFDEPSKLFWDPAADTRGIDKAEVQRRLQATLAPSAVNTSTWLSS